MDWFAIKTAITDATGLGRDALHLLAGFGAHLLIAAALRTWLGSLWPPLLILIAALGNEAFDLTYERWGVGERAWQWMESVKDVVTTMLLPAALVLLARFGGRLLTRPAGSK